MSDPKLSFEPLLDSDQAAAILRIHPKTLQRMARSGRVTGYRIGNLWRFHASDLQASMIGANTVLDSNTVRQYSLATTRARN